MMPVTGRLPDFGASVLDLASSCCFSNASIERSLVNSFPTSRSRTDRGRRLVCCRQNTATCRVYSTKTPETLLEGVGQGPPPVFNLKSDSRTNISLTKLFDIVADDLQTLNDNLQSIVGAENPVLMSAAEQIFGAGGKRVRPALVFLVSRATAELVGLKDLKREHCRLAEIIEMIHTASLIHDDVLDESDLRRG